MHIDQFFLHLSLFIASPFYEYVQYMLFLCWISINSFID